MRKDNPRKSHIDRPNYATNEFKGYTSSPVSTLTSVVTRPSPNQNPAPLNFNSIGFPTALNSM